MCYWFEKARAHIAGGYCLAAGLVATNSIRGGANRKVLERIVDSTAIFTAWSDEPWVNEGAAVRVSLVCFGLAPSPPRGEGRGEGANPALSPHSPLTPNPSPPRGEGSVALLNGQPVAIIHADLTMGGLNESALDVTQASKLPENSSVCFVGTSKKASFDLPGDKARGWLLLPNPNGQRNHVVVKPWINGNDLVQRPSDTWIVDFGVKASESDSALFEAPFAYVLATVKPEKMAVRSESEKRYWWLHARTAPDMRAAIGNTHRYVATSIVAKHRIFVWRSSAVLPSHAVCVIARADDTTFGLLHSRFHELWSLRMGTSLEDRPRYTPTTTFETFPFPAGLTPSDTREPAPPPAEGPVLPVVSAARQPAAGAIAQAAFGLNRLREAWLNPPEWVDWVITPEEEQAGFPRRPVAKPGHESDLKKRTLTNLYNARPAWLSMAHEALDRAVAAAYGWDDYSPAMADEEILRRLLARNHECAATVAAS